jgi:hypothetical protein
MKSRVNTYLAILFITLAGSGAALMIVRIATDDMVATTFRGSEANYFLLQQSILNER